MTASRASLLKSLGATESQKVSEPDLRIVKNDDLLELCKQKCPDSLKGKKRPVKDELVEALNPVGVRFKDLENGTLEYLVSKRKPAMVPVEAKEKDATAPAPPLSKAAAAPPPSKAGVAPPPSLPLSGRLSSTIIPKSHLILVPKASLKLLCKEFKLPTTGTETDLANCLLPQSLRYPDLDREDLKEIAWGLGLDVACGKQELVARLTGSESVPAVLAEPVSPQHIGLLGMLGTKVKKGAKYKDVKLEDLWELADWLEVSVNVETREVIEMIRRVPKGSTGADVAATETSKRKKSSGRTVWRQNVTYKAGKVWQLRNDQDLYTLWPKDQIVQEDPQVDHIIEVQFMKTAFDFAVKHAHTSVSSRLRSDAARLIEMTNDHLNLNVTTENINQHC